MTVIDENESEVEVILGLGSKVGKKWLLLTISTMTKLAVVVERSVEKISIPKMMVFGTKVARERGTVQLFP